MLVVLLMQYIQPMIQDDKTTHDHISGHTTGLPKRSDSSGKPHSGGTVLLFYDSLDGMWQWLATLGGDQHGTRGQNSPNFS